MDHVLKSMTELSEREKQREGKLAPSQPYDSFSLPLLLPLPLPPKIKQAAQKVAAVGSSVRQLRQEVEAYKFHLLTTLSEWEVQATNNFKAITERISAHPERGEGRDYIALQQEVAMLGRSLAL
jgi:hypothetical protein